MKHLLLFESYNTKERLLLSTFKNGIENSRKEVIDYAIENGFETEKYEDELFLLAYLKRDSYALKVILGSDRFNEFFNEDGTIKNYDFFYIEDPSTNNYDFYNIPLSFTNSVYIYIHDDYKNDESQKVPDVDFEFLDDEYDSVESVGIYFNLSSSHINATIETTSSATYYIIEDHELLPEEVRFIDDFLTSKYPRLKSNF